ncbi:MAG: alkaline phosphatase family protein [Longimicrobiales bacterium]|nr:alkaline phosphatase family protein [Longimicrobiales bacterium]
MNLSVRPAVLVTLAALLVPWACAPADREAVAERPALVVMVVVDQLRADLLERYAPALDGGFARLNRESLHFTSASHRHASTSTAVGHATLSTGASPGRHGIVGNTFRAALTEGPGAPEGWSDEVYGVSDPEAPILGFPEASGRSPRNLLAPGLADWMRAADPETRVVSVSRKDRGAIPLAGHVRGEVYWIQDTAGRFVTSSYYRDAYPDWVEAFNRERMPRIMGDSVWARVTPDGHLGLARRDSATYEGDGVHVVFPHRRAEEASGAPPRAQYVWAAETPAGDRAVLDFARAAMAATELGRRPGGTDLLALSFSQTDYVGHAYGPGSQEQLSNLVHLDGLLAELFTMLDEQVGPGRWVLGLSADHGVMTAPEWLTETGTPAERLSRDEVRQTRRVAADAAVAAASPREVPDRVARAVSALPWVERVLVPADLAAAAAGDAAGAGPLIGDTIADLFRRSYHPQRSWGVLARYGVYVQFRRDVLFRDEPRGTTHGSPWWHDRHVPLMVMGPGVPPGASAEAAYTTDLAPTLAALAGIPFPEEVEGRTLVGGSGETP